MMAFVGVVIAYGVQAQVALGSVGYGFAWLRLEELERWTG